MKALLTRHFATKDPIIAGIVSISAPYELAKGAIPGFGFRSTGALHRQPADLRRGGAQDHRAAHGLARGPLSRSGRTGRRNARSTARRGLFLREGRGAAGPRRALRWMAACPTTPRSPRWMTKPSSSAAWPVRGIGRWTVQMLLMFHFGRHDVMPADDYGVRQGFRLAYGLKGLPRPKALLAYAERWKPYRSAGAWYLWRAIELHQRGQAAQTQRAVRRASRWSETPKPMQDRVGKERPRRAKRRGRRQLSQRESRGRNARLSRGRPALRRLTTGRGTRRQRRARRRFPSSRPARAARRRP